MSWPMISVLILVDCMLHALAKQFISLWNVSLVWDVMAASVHHQQRNIQKDNQLENHCWYNIVIKEKIKKDIRLKLSNSITTITK